MNHSMKRFQAVLFLTLVLGGCAKDRSLEDYESDRNSEHIGKIQEKSGTYAGELVADDNGSVVAGIVMTVSPDTKVQSTGTSASDPRQIGFQGSLVIKSIGSDLRAGFNNAFYDFTSSNYRISIPVTSSSQGVEVEGNFEDDAVTGVIYASGYNEFAAHFRLARNGSLPPTKKITAMETGAMSRIPTLVTKYAGTFKNPISGAVEKIAMKITNIPTTDESFLNFFRPVQSVDVQIQIGNFQTNYQIQDYKGTELDKIRGTLQGLADHSSLSCTQVQGSQNWKCAIESGAGTLTSLLSLDSSTASTKK